MARIRSIKPDIWDDARIEGLSRDARLLFIGLITQADDEGYLRGRPMWVKSTVFPGDEELTVSEVAGWLEELDASGLVWCYENDGQQFIWLPNWDRHQSIDKRYKKESKYPRAPEERPTRTRRAPDEDSTQEWSGEEGIGEEGTREIVPIPDAVLSVILADLIEENGANRPKVSRKWADAERLMLDRDHRDPVEAERLIRWSQASEFWRANILSMPKFREKYDQLLLQAKADKPKSSSPGMDNAKRRAAMVREQRTAA